MNQQNNEESSLKQSSRRLYAEVFSLKDTLYHDLLERFKGDHFLTEHKEQWKTGIMAAAISTALFSSALTGSKEFPYVYSYLKIKLKAYHPEGEAAIESCMGVISNLLNGAEYNAEAFSEGLALWLYFSMRGKETFIEEETVPYMLAGQYINQYYYNWFDKQG
ncbi:MULTISPECIES: hypothetical protein [Bacillales]|uniref:hypothetical protein n=1 Tax=Bacillales TaxID=1385 RepID=UPI0006A7B6F9|nr:MULTISPECIES: hypothetical protein [Bacillales]OBZ16716.1 hypothetical protein A7975_02045 [Bacillus sp. FJAT-26390]